MAQNDCAVKLIINGIVQGVGYRAFVKSAAEKRKLNGYVRNLENGSVEAVVFGNSDDIKLFINDINVDIEGGPSVFNISSERLELSGEPPKSFYVKW
ncbi:MAG: acylphosphatase [Candidatus Micrarchaeaceae archaeon]